MGKYDPLYRWLINNENEIITLSLFDIETVIGSRLPKSAYTYSAWWGNNNMSPQGKSWMNAGFEVIHGSQVKDNHQVTFLKKEIDLVDIDIWFGYDDSTGGIDLNGYPFYLVQELEPKRNLWGKIKQFSPQMAWFKKHQKPLHSFGHGPFCRFSISPYKYYRAKGVYALFDGEHLFYIGKTDNLAKRINNEYGLINAKDCYIGSPETNCKINGFILYKYLKQERIFLLYFETNDYDSIALELVRDLRPPINVV